MPRKPVLMASSTRRAVSDFFQAVPYEFFERFKYEPVLEREAFENRLGARARCGGALLSGLSAEVVDGRDHAGRVEEGRMIGIDQRSEAGSLFLRGGQEFIVGIFDSAFEPAAAAGLQQP